jgi:hypothetical protein
MNALELYKRLPRKNCGECSLKACMPFAVSVVKGDALLEECPLLAPADREALQASVVQGDWREELILKLSAEIGGVDFAANAAGIGAQLVDGALQLRCFGRDFTVALDGTIRTAGKTTPWIRILILHYIRTAGKAPVSGTWAAYAELKAGLVKASSFERDCEVPLLACFRRDAGRTAAALERMGARRAAGFPTADAWVIDLLPKVPVAVLHWPAEEEFPARVRVLFDATADQFLDAESLIFLGEGLVKNLEAQVA